MRVQLSVFRGNELDRELELAEGDVLRIGREPGSDLRLVDLQVAREHARLSLSAAGLRVDDLGSRGGTILDGVRLSNQGGLAELPCTIRLGRHRLELRECDAAGAGIWDRYQKLRRLGQGAFGQVHAARRRADGLDVAIKELAWEDADEEEGQRDRFLREARLCETLEHPNLVRLLETSLEGSRAYQVLELVAGGRDLRDLLNEEGAQPVRFVLGVAEDTAAGLGALHAAGLVHRDIKPANLLLCRDGGVKITDFGLARSLVGGNTLTKSSLGLGTLAYVAPEQAADARRARPTADLYALGATLYELLTGRPPLAPRPLEAMLAALRDEEPEPLGELRPDCPPALAVIVHRLLAKDPGARYAKVKLLLRRLAAVRRDLEANAD